MCFSVKSPAVQQPTAPTVASSYADYVNAYPQLESLNQQYQPQEAQQQFDLTQQYAPQYTQLENQINQQSNPYTYGLQEQLAKQATDYLNNPGVPQDVQSQYRDQLRSEVGNNAGSGIAGDYISRGLVNLNEQYKQYYQNLGLSLTGRQPLNQPANPAFTNPAAGANSALGFNQSIYGTQANMYNNSANNSLAMRGQNLGLIGAGIGAAGTFGGSFFGGR